MSNGRKLAREILTPKTSTVLIEKPSLIKQLK